MLNMSLKFQIINPRAMSSIRKCKACNLAVKGHPGPYGMAKCKNVPLAEDEVTEVVEAVSAKTVEMEATHEYGKADAKRNVVTNLTKQKHVHEEEQSEVPEVDDIDSSNAEHSMNNVPDEASKNNMESSEEENDASHFLEDDIGEDKSTNKNKMHIDESDPLTVPQQIRDA